MEAFSGISQLWLVRALWLGGFAVAFALLVRFMPCNPGMFWWKDKRAAATDSVYWFFVPLVMRVAQLLLLFTGIALVFGRRDPAWMRDFFAHGYGPVREWPFWLQCAFYMLAADFMMYWIHRLFHTRRMWGFHAVHHSPKQLDWMSTTRFHPVNTLLEFSLTDTTMLLLGLPPEVIVALAPFNMIYSAMVHANLNWTFGPLKYVFASPIFHRWHHTGYREGGMRNFAPTFPFIDLAFGTFHMPKDKRPENYGVHDKNFPTGFWGQMAHPLRKSNISLTKVGSPSDTV